MSEIFDAISSASSLIDSIGSALVVLACWRLYKLKKGRLLLTAHLSSIAFFAVDTLFYLPLYFISWAPLQWQDYASQLFEKPIIWETTGNLYFIGLTVTILALSRWFFLQLPKLEAPPRKPS